MSNIFKDIASLIDLVKNALKFKQFKPQSDGASMFTMFSSPAVDVDDNLDQEVDDTAKKEKDDKLEEEEEEDEEDEEYEDEDEETDESKTNIIPLSDENGGFAIPDATSMGGMLGAGGGGGGGGRKKKKKKSFFEMIFGFVLDPLGAIISGIISTVKLVILAFNVLMHLDKCAKWFVLYVLGTILYIPFTIFFVALGLSGLEQRIWAALEYADNLIYCFSSRYQIGGKDGFHIIHYSDEIREICFLEKKPKHKCASSGSGSSKSSKKGSFLGKLSSQLFLITVILFVLLSMIAYSDKQTPPPTVIIVIFIFFLFAFIGSFLKLFFKRKIINRIMFYILSSIFYLYVYLVPSKMVKEIFKPQEVHSIFPETILFLFRLSLPIIITMSIVITIMTYYT
jgi:hypothetical protein